MKNRKSIIGIMIIIIVSLTFVGCKKESIKIGFVCDLTTKNSQLAIDARNAILLELETLNNNGGINGAKVEIVIKDDQSDLEHAVQIHQEFLDEDVHLIIGHMISKMASTISHSQSEELLFLSPSISTDSLTKIDDYFLRSAPINSRQAVILQQYFHKYDVNELTIVYDQNNTEYTETLLKGLQETYVDDTHKITHKIGFDSSVVNLSEVAKTLGKLNLENILFITQASDTAYFQQYLTALDRKHKAYSVSWSMTKDLIQNGGHAVEGMIFVGVFFPEGESERYLDFKMRFSEKYGYEPSFIAILAADAFNVLVEGIENSKNVTATDVKQAILDLKEFEGYHTTFTVDQFGDNDRQYMLFELVDGVFEPMRDWQ